MKLTHENIHALFNFGSPNARQKATLKIGRKPRKGWLVDLIGTEISEALYTELMDCKGRRPKCIPKKQWRKPCVPCE